MPKVFVPQPPKMVFSQAFQISPIKSDRWFLPEHNSKLFMLSSNAYQKWVPRNLRVIHFGAKRSFGSKGYFSGLLVRYEAKKFHEFFAVVF